MAQKTNTTLDESAKALFKSCAQDGYATKELQRYKMVQETIDKITDAINNLDKIEGLKDVVERLSLRQGDIDVNTGYPEVYMIKMFLVDDNTYGFNIHVQPLTDEEGNIVFRDIASEAGMNEDKKLSPDDFGESVANEIYKLMTLPEKAALETAYGKQAVNNDMVRKPDVA